MIAQQTETAETFDLMKRWINGHAQLVRVQTELGTAVRITKKEAIKLLNTLEQRGVLPELDCTAVSDDMKYLVIIQVGKFGIYLDR